MKNYMAAANTASKWCSKFGFGLIGYLVLVIGAYGQKPLTGKVVLPNGEAQEPLEAAKLQWKNTALVAYSDSLGRFSLPRTTTQDTLIVSLVGFYTDTLIIPKRETSVLITMVPTEGQEVVITDRRKASYISTLDPFRTETLTSEEFTKAACCNLSESFETNPSVDAVYTDAITGVKQIQLLGLNNIYTLVTMDNMPFFRGLSAMHGLTLIPSTWVQSLYITKGAGSVVNGYESMAGQINIELLKPDTTQPKNYLNFYLNSILRNELNYARSYNISPKLHGITMFHASSLPQNTDMNHDHFLDNPKGYQVGLTQSLQLRTGTWEGIYTLQANYDDKQAGQLHYKLSEHTQSPYYGTHTNIQRIAASAKTGYVFKEKPYKSFGSQVYAIHHKNHFDFGRSHYEGVQNSFYANLLYQNKIIDTRHTLKTGISFLADNYQEEYSFLPKHERTELVPGAFAEYTWKPSPQFTLVAGARADYHFYWKRLYTTPRLHLRYAPTEKLIFRASAGRGQRTPNFFTDYIGYFVSSRTVVLPDTLANLWGLKPEISWNYGVSMQKLFSFLNKDASFVLDFYRTDFQNQVIPDRDISPLQIVFQNHSFASFANALQITLEIEPLERMDVKLAYKYYDVQQQLAGKLQPSPLIAKHRGFINLSYETRTFWQFDLTLQYNGRKRLPSTAASPSIYQLPTYSPPFFFLIGQISKTWRKKLQLYLGAENLTNFRQLSPVVNPENPFSNYFDAAMVWGPINPMMLYVGFRWNF